MTQQYGTLKVDFITFTSGTTGNETDVTLTVSGLSALSDSGMTITGDITARNVTATGTLSGATITGDILNATSITGVTGVFTTLLSGASITGELISGTSGIYTYLSGASITGNLILGTSGVFTNVTGTTINSVTGSFTTGTFSNLGITGTITGNTVDFGIGAFATSTSTTGYFPDTSGTSAVGSVAFPFASGVFTNLIVNDSLTATLTTGLFGSGTESAPSISFDDDRDTGFYNAAANEVRITTSGNDRLTVDSTGNVGIGITSPTARLHIANDQGGAIGRILIDANVTSGYDTRIDATDDGLEFSAQSNIRGILFNTGGTPTERLRITGNGLVGIGTTAPWNNLTVNGQGTAGDVTSARQFSVGASSTYQLAFGYYQTGAAQPFAGTLQALDNGSGTFLSLNPSGGNVGIGTTGPDAKLTISGTNTAGGIKIVDSTASFASPGIEVIGKRSDGNVSSCFAGKLLLAKNRTDAAINLKSILGNISFGGNHTNGTEANILYSAAVLAKAEGTFNAANDMPTSLVFHTGSDGWSPDTPNDEPGNEAMRITSDGNVGIGTISPQSTLEVYRGTISVTDPNSITTGDAGTFGCIWSQAAVLTQAGFQIAFNTGSNNARTEKVRIDSSGRLLVGTSTATTIYGATSALQVAGSDFNTASISLLRTGDATGESCALYLARKRTTGILANGDRVGVIAFAGRDTTDLNTPLATIAADVDGTPGANDMPGRLVFATTADGASTPTERMRIASSGKIAIGTTAPEGYPGKLIVVGDGTVCDREFNSRVASSVSNAERGFMNVIDGVERLHIYSPNGGDNVWEVGGTERFRIDSSGNVGIGTSAPGEKLEVTGNVYITDQLRVNKTSFSISGSKIETVVGGSQVGIAVVGSSSTVQRIMLSFHNPDNTNVGQISIKNSITTYSTSSDYRLKENVVNLTGAIDRLKLIDVYRFNFIGHEPTVDGFIAHELQDVVPECVTGTKDEVDDEGNPVYQGIDQSKIVPLLTAALQEALAKIETLEQRLTDAGL